jgi:hypothetical protein
MRAVAPRCAAALSTRAALAAPPGAAATLVRRGVVRTRAAQRPCPALMLYPGLTARPFWSPADLPAPLAAGVAAVAAARGALLAEFDALRAAAPRGDYALREAEHALNDGAWTWHTAVARGRPRADFALAAPRAAAALAAVPGLLLGGIPFAYAFFSALAPGAAIAPHFGPANTRLRVHVPLRVPAGGGAALTVAGERRVWAEGEPVVFDDSFEHAAENKSDGERVVLLFDVWHPELSADERAAVEAMFGEARAAGWMKE